jgi:hypothetical protein
VTRQNRKDIIDCTESDWLGIGKAAYGLVGDSETCERPITPSVRHTPRQEHVVLGQLRRAIGLRLSSLSLQLLAFRMLD